MSFSRREMLTTFGAVTAGQALLSEAVTKDKNPAAQVADRSSSIKIRKMQATWVGSSVYVKIETNHGVTGWGEIKGVDPRVAKPLAENPTRIEHIWQKLYRAHRNIRGGSPDSLETPSCQRLRVRGVRLTEASRPIKSSRMETR